MFDFTKIKNKKVLNHKKLSYKAPILITIACVAVLSLFCTQLLVWGMLVGWLVLMWIGFIVIKKLEIEIDINKITDNKSE